MRAVTIECTNEICMKWETIFFPFFFSPPREVLNECDGTVISKLLWPEEKHTIIYVLQTEIE